MARMRIIGAVVGACLFSTMALAATDLPAPLVAKCQACHGDGGNSPTGAVPRLNGQQAAYIAKRLHDFSNLASEDPHAMKAMWPVVSDLSNDTFDALAAYYAGQPPTKSRPQGPLAALGRKIYANGATTEEIRPCQACHGAQGEGGAAAPRLAGQHAAYLTSQLERLRLLTRVDDTMFHNARGMSDQQIRALVAYLAAD
ncbi:MAG: c-type cytochrome [Rhizomicrobium sp.]